MKKSETVKEISETIDNKEPPLNIEVGDKDTSKNDYSNINSEIVNEISESKSTGLVKDIENVNLGQISVIRSLERLSPARSSLDLSLYPKLPEDNDKIVSKNLIKCEVLTKCTAEISSSIVII